MPKPASTASGTPPATPPPTPPPASINRGIMDDLANVAINEFMPRIAKWLLDLVPKNRYEAIFQNKAKYWNIALPLLNYYSLRAFNAPKVVDDLTTDFFAQLRREINIRAGKNGDENKPEKTASEPGIRTENLLRIFLTFPENLEIYGRIVAGKKSEKVKKIRSFLNTMTPEELIAFFTMDDSHREVLLATFIAKSKRAKSFGKSLNELGKRVKTHAKKLEQSAVAQTVMTGLVARMRADRDRIAAKKSTHTP